MAWPEAHISTPNQTTTQWLKKRSEDSPSNVPKRKLPATPAAERLLKPSNVFQDGAIGVCPLACVLIKQSYDFFILAVTKIVI